jgi:hypothetical protein
MNKHLVLFVFIVAFTFSAISVPAQGTEMVFIGVAGHQSTRTKSVAEALVDAAKKVAFYHSVEAAIIETEESGSSFYFDTELRYDENYQKYIADLKFDPITDVYEVDGTFFITARYIVRNPVITNFIRHRGNLRPWWVDNPPKEIKDYPAGTGFSGKQSSYAKTIVKSYESAVFALLQNNHVYAVTSEEAWQDSFFYQSIQMASGTLKGFYVLDFWTNPETKAVWTLAIAREIIADPLLDDKQ